MTAGTAAAFFSTALLTAAFTALAIYRYTATAVRTRTDIQLVSTVLQLDVEIEAAVDGYIVLVAVTCESGYRSGVDVNCPNSLVVCIAQLAEVT